MQAHTADSGKIQYQPPRVVDVGDLVELTADGHAQGGALGKCGVDADGKSGLEGHDHSCSV